VLRPENLLKGIVYSFSVPSKDQPRSAADAKVDLAVVGSQLSDESSWMDKVAPLGALMRREMPVYLFFALTQGNCV